MARRCFVSLAIILVPVSLLAEEAPPAREARFEVGIRTGFALPMGRIAAEPSADLSDGLSGQVPIWLDAGVRVTRRVSVGVYLQYGVLIPRDCRIDSCSGFDVRLGAEVRFDVEPDSPTDPWVALGAGYEILGASARDGATAAEETLRGVEIANLQAGLDFLVSSRLRVGPFVCVTIGEYSSGSAALGSRAMELDDLKTALHEWVAFGVRGRFEL